MQIMNIFHVLVAIAMVAFILVQRGQGATAGAAFGSGASGTVFGSRGAGSFLSRATWVLATLFCLISLTMAVVVSRNLGAPEADLGVMGDPTAVEEQAPVEAFEAPDGESQASDLPALDTLTNESVEEGLPVPAEDDLPEVEEQPAPVEGDGSDGSP